MNQSQAKELLPIIQAFSEGKEVQWFSDTQDCWVDELSPGFSPGFNWRIKPEKKVVEFWVNVYVQGGGLEFCRPHATQQEAEKYQSDSGFIDCIHVRKEYDI